MDKINITNPTPEIGPYTKLTPFRFWCQKVLPLVYDESLSYYELLCKVVDYLNKTMEDVDNMIDDMGEFRDAYTDFTGQVKDAIEELESFVNDYFDNLDVQEEINNKLDAMADAGYFNTLFDTLFRSDVITEAGNVTSAWIAANLLQETGYVLDKSLTIENAAADAKAAGVSIDTVNLALNNVKKDDLFRSNAFDGFYLQGYYKNLDGAYDASRTDYVCGKHSLDVENVEIIKVFVAANISDAYFLSYDSSNNFLGTSGNAVVTHKQSDGYIYLTKQNGGIKPNAKYMRFSLKDANGITPYTAPTDTLIYLEHIGLNGVNMADISFENNGFDFFNWQNFMYYYGDSYFGETINRIGIVKPFVIKKDMIVTVDSGYAFSVQYFSSTTINHSTEVKSTGWKTTPIKLNTNEIVLINIKKTDESTITPNEANCLHLLENVDLIFQQEIRNSLKVHVQHNGAGYYFPAGAKNRNTMTTPIYTKYALYVSTDSSHRIGYQLYDGYITGTAHLVYAETNWLGNFVIPANSYFCITLINTDTSPTTKEDNDAVICYDIMPSNEQVIEATNYLSNRIGKDTGNYLITADLQKKNVIVEDVPGQLTYFQAFCIYDNRFYSINGTNIAVQDYDFSLLENELLNSGHGNSLQIGHNGKAYASGWDDQKVYIIDLETLTIDGTISLPTTGYTTCAIDDVNQIAYIFERASYPDTEVCYDFIVYDYGNSQVISTKKTTRAFGAMQACDFFNDSIIVVNGFGTNAVPNYYLVYNTSGEIIGEYILPKLQNVEPEGVCFNRDTYELYISDVNKNLYKIVPYPIN